MPLLFMHFLLTFFLQLSVENDMSQSTYELAVANTAHLSITKMVTVTHAW